MAIIGTELSHLNRLRQLLSVTGLVAEKSLKEKTGKEKKMAEEYRTEKDSMGEVKVPKSAYYGAQTQRAVENFPVSGIGFPPRFIRVFVFRFNLGPPATPARYGFDRSYTAGTPSSPTRFSSIQDKMAKAKTIMDARAIQAQR